MTPERWQKIQAILDQAEEQPYEGRLDWLHVVCEGDDELLAEVQSFLAHEEQLAGFIEEPVLSRLYGEEESLGCFPAGDRVGPYRLVALLGEGGMGAVYLAEREAEFEQRVALKLIQRGLASEDVVRRFHAERQILASLEHPNIARLLDGGTSQDGLPYFAMELVEGERIDHYCDQHRLSVRARLELFLQVCSALQEAHQNLVVHRDLKPGNILVDATGTPKLLDFGIAKVLNPEAGTEGHATVTVNRAMTLQYASPEQLLDEPMGPASDIYSLGVLLYRLLTGRLPYQIEQLSHLQLLKAVCEEEPALPSEVVVREVEVLSGRELRRLTPEEVSEARGCTPGGLRRALAGDLDSILIKTLRKEPRQRYASVEQLAMDVRRHLDGRPVQARQSTVGYRAGKFVRRHRLGLFVAAAVLLLACAFTVLLVRQLHETQRALGRAEGVSAFLIDLFQAASPNRRAGEEPTLRELLDRGRQKLEAGLQDEPEVRATLLLKLGEVYVQLGDYAQARGLLAEVVELLRRRHTGDQPQLAAALNNLANVDYWSGETRSAEALFRECIAMRRRLGDTENLIKPMNNLAAILMQRGDFAEAEGIYREGLALRRTSLPPAHPNIATSLRSLATAYYTAGNLDAAEPLLREALDIRRQAFGGASPGVATILGSLGRLEQARGNLEQAEDFYTQALSIRRARLGEDHLHTALAKKDLASVLLDQGEVATAGVLLTQALAVLNSVRSEDDWSVAEAEGILGTYLAAEGRNAEAEVCLREAHQTLARTRGRQAIYTRTAARHLADFYRATGRSQLAADLAGDEQSLPEP